MGSLKIRRRAATSCSKMTSQSTSAATSISLSLTEDYAPSWGVWEGCRELIQNWHDGCLEHAVVASDVQWECHAPDSGDTLALHRFEARTADGSSVGTAVYDP